MAEIVVTDGVLAVELSPAEKVEAVHGDLKVPLAAVRAVEVVEDPPAALHGWRAPGTRLPGLLAVGTWRGPDGKIFAVLYRDRPGIRIRLEGAAYDSILLTADDPAALAARIREAAHL